MTDFNICYSFARNTSYYPFAEIFRDFFNIDSDDLEESIAEKITQNLPLLLGLNTEVLSPMAREAIVFIGFILGVKLGDDYDIPTAQMTPEEIKTGVFRSTAWFFEELSKSKPVLLSLQDLHYADNTTIELLAYLFKALKSSPVMIFLLMLKFNSYFLMKII